MKNITFNEVVQVPPEDPFANDALKRDENIKILTDFIKITNQAMVLAINSSWGTGKTTFIKMWKQYLENQNFNTLYFNAWNNDFVEEPFIAFINEFEKLLANDTKLEKFKDISKKIVKGLIPAVIKIGTSGLLDLNRINLDEEFEKTITSYSEKIANEQIKSFQDTKNAMITFKEMLKEFVEEQYKENNKPIIVFVDELDRCRPDFAIQLLEKIKHLF